MIPLEKQNEAIRQAVQEGSLPCAVAFALAAQLGVSPAAVRETADAMGVRISLCQLGLFGYQAFGSKRLSCAMASAPETLRRALSEGADKSGLPCAAAWALADRHGVPRLLVGSAAESLGVKIDRCQLGCFE